MRRAALALLAAVVVAAAGCGGDDESGDGSKLGTETRVPVGPVTGSIPDRTSTSTTATEAAVPADVKPEFGRYMFLTPSKNIGCDLSKQGARCDIRDYSWKPPPEPASCEFDYGGSLNVSGKRRGEVGCVSDTVLGATEVAAYGTFLTKGKFRCTSRAAGVRCLNTATGHGFFIARERYELF